VGCTGPLEAVDPDPDRATLVGEPEALLAMERFPESLPVDPGANFTLIFAELPAAMVIGIVGPVMLNPEPLAVAELTVRLAKPVLDTVTDEVELLPTLTLPKLRLVGFTDIAGAAVTPLPERGTPVGEVGALLTSDKLPETVPVADGAN